MEDFHNGWLPHFEQISTLMPDVYTAMHTSTLPCPHCQTSILPDIHALPDFHTSRISHCSYTFTLAVLHSAWLSTMLDFHTTRLLQYPTSTSSTISALPHFHTTKHSPSKTQVQNARLPHCRQTSILSDFTMPDFMHIVDYTMPDFHTPNFHIQDTNMLKTSCNGNMIVLSKVNFACIQRPWATLLLHPCLNDIVIQTVLNIIVGLTMLITHDNNVVHTLLRQQP